MLEVIASMEQEIAKSQNEIRCATSDIQKASNRIAFCLSAIHDLKNRDIQEK